MTHVDNIPHILKFGITGIHSYNMNPDYKPIGDSSLISYRSDKKVTDVDGKSIILGNFTPFYFGVRMPMLYVIQHGGNFVPKAVNPSDIIYIYIAVSLASVISSNPEFYFTDGHATDMLTNIYGSKHINSLINIVDWNAIRTKWWSGEGIDTDVKRRKQAEFLIRGDISVKHIRGYVCSCEETARKLITLGIDPNTIKTIPQAYY